MDTIIKNQDGTSFPRWYRQDVPAADIQLFCIYERIYGNTMQHWFIVENTISSKSSKMTKFLQLIYIRKEGLKKSIILIFIPRDLYYLLVCLLYETGRKDEFSHELLQLYEIDDCMFYDRLNREV